MSHVQVNEHYEPRASIMTISPEFAKRLLAATSMQRRLDETNVANIAAAIVAGRWRLNGESIILNGDGVLDGQHRLEACVRSGRSIRSVVVGNVDPSVFPSIDTGKKRTGADVLGISGYTNSIKLAAAMRWFHAEKIGALGWTKIPTVPNEVLLQMAGQYHGLNESIKATGNFIQRLLPPGLATFLHYRFSEVDADAAATFFAALDTGEGMFAERGVYWLRERLLANRNAKAKLTQRDIAALTIKAFHFDRLGVSVKQLRWRSLGPQAENFPSIDGEEL